MLTLFNVIHFVRGALVVLFVGVSLLMLAAGLLHRSRFKNIRMSWGSGRLFGLPLGPSVFLGGILSILAYTVATGDQVFSIGWIAAVAYACGGICWYVGALLFGATIVADWGISTKSGRRHILIPWHEITDYVATERRRHYRYVFFRIDAQGYKQRMEVMVPSGIKERFQSIVAHSLDSRFDRSIQRPMGQRALEQ